MFDDHFTTRSYTQASILLISSFSIGGARLQSICVRVVSCTTSWLWLWIDLIFVYLTVYLEIWSFYDIVLPMSRRVEYCPALPSRSSCSAPLVGSSPRCLFNRECISILMTSQSNRTHLLWRTWHTFEANLETCSAGGAVACARGFPDRSSNMEEEAHDCWPLCLLLLLHVILSRSWAIIHLKEMGKEGLDRLLAGMILLDPRF